MNPMNTRTKQLTKRIPHVRLLSTLGTLFLIQSLIANVALHRLSTQRSTTHKLMEGPMVQQAYAAPEVRTFL
jgi:hypothetical protein